MRRAFCEAQATTLDTLIVALNSQISAFKEAQSSEQLAALGAAITSAKEGLTTANTWTAQTWKPRTSKPPEWWQGQRTSAGKVLKEAKAMVAAAEAKLKAEEAELSGSPLVQTCGELRSSPVDPHFAQPQRTIPCLPWTLRQYCSSSPVGSFTHSLTQEVELNLANGAVSSELVDGKLRWGDEVVALNGKPPRRRLDDTEADAAVTFDCSSCDSLSSASCAACSAEARSAGDYDHATKTGTIRLAAGTSVEVYSAHAADQQCAEASTGPCDGVWCEETDGGWLELVQSSVDATSIPGNDSWASGEVTKEPAEQSEGRSDVAYPVNV